MCAFFKLQLFRIAANYNVNLSLDISDTSVFSRIERRGRLGRVEDEISCEKYVRIVSLRNGRIFARLAPDDSARREGKGRWSETGSVYGHKLTRPVSSVYHTRKYIQISRNSLSVFILSES